MFSSKDAERADLIATKQMCSHCFDVILKELLKEKKQSHSSSNHEESFLNGISPDTMCPLFVTWDKKNKSEYLLRGCIGTLAPYLLRKGLAEYAAISAFRDHRFKPISIGEVPMLRVGVSLLTNYEECSNCFDWEVGKHGIIIKFEKNWKNYNGE